MINPQEEITRTGTPDQLIQLLHFKLEVLKMAEGIWKDDSVKIDETPRSLLCMYDRLMYIMAENREKTNVEVTSPPTKNILSFEEVCAYIGMSKSYVYRLTSKGLIPHYKPLGKQMFFKKDEIDNWLLSNPVTPTIKTDDNLGEINTTIEK